VKYSLEILLRRCKDAKLPTEDTLKKVLVDQFKVPEEWVDECIKILITNGRYTQIIQDISGSPHILLGEIKPKVEEEEGKIPPEPTPTPPIPPIPEPLIKQIFVGHGKNRVPLEQLKKILDQFQIPYEVAIDEPHVGRPISKKVADIMRNCSSAIFVFTADEAYVDAEGNKILRPSDNVVYELGAATILYENRIVIFKEEGVTFASDFSDLGYITFETNNISAKSLELLRELIGLGFLKITPT